MNLFRRDLDPAWFLTAWRLLITAAAAVALLADPPHEQRAGAHQAQVEKICLEHAPATAQDVARWAP